MTDGRLNLNSGFLTFNLYQTSSFMSFRQFLLGYQQLVFSTQNTRLFVLYVLSCLVVSDSLSPMDYSPGSSIHGDSPHKNNWSGLSCPSPGDLLNPGIELRSPALQVDSLPSEPQRKPAIAYCDNICQMFHFPSKSQIFYPKISVGNLFGYFVRTDINKHME